MAVRQLAEDVAAYAGTVLDKSGAPLAVVRDATISSRWHPRISGPESNPGPVAQWLGVARQLH